ncbi:SDR family NAD(P)-dependent oxidoreductase [Streptomyces sp. OE57]|uniref:SDR family NAD(P)-dependent oxidoreductase n=1 Tax=Streptomyces lacaronensis TaxID=3379885 RepID=UPI0039B738F0
MSIYQMRTYHLASESAVADYLVRWAAHVSTLAEFDVVTHGFSAVPGNPKAVVALVSFQDGVDPDAVIRDYMNSDGFRNDMANFDMSQIERVDTLLLAPRSAVQTPQSMTTHHEPGYIRRLEGRVALITGGARGQGEAEARRFAREGAHVYVCDVLSEQGEALAAEICAAGGRAQFKSLDVTDADQWNRVVREIGEETGRLDILINNAGTNVRYPLTGTTHETWDKIFNVNLTGQFLGMQACAPLMERTGGGSMVNIGSTAGIMGHPVVAYSSSKWGVRGVTKAAAIDLAPMGIRVNAMHPGVVETPMMDSTSNLFKDLVSMTPLGRAANSEEMAAAALFLASDDASFVTGIDLPVDGGFSELAAYGEIWKRLNS